MELGRLSLLVRLLRTYLFFKPATSESNKTTIRCFEKSTLINTLEIF